MYRQSLFIQASVAVCSLVLVSKAVVAGCVRFDIPDTAVCVDAVVPDRHVSHSDYRLMKIDLDVSAFVQFQHGADLAQFVYVIELPERRARIIDYSPKTELISDIAGTKSISTQSETSASFGLNAASDVSAFGSLSGNVSNGDRESDSVKFERLPEKRLLAASGTLDRGAAVYFKLRPSSQTTLEGSKRFTILIEAPNSWRADYLRVRCAAYSVNKSLDGGRPICGSMAFHVGLHRQGDQQGFQLARQLVASERRLRSLAASYEDQISDETDTDVADLLLAVFRKSDKRSIPKNWVDAIVFDRSVSRTLSFERHLPDEVREAVSGFRTARVRLATAEMVIPQS